MLIEDVEFFIMVMIAITVFCYMFYILFCKEDIYKKYNLPSDVLCGKNHKLIIEESDCEIKDLDRHIPSPTPFSSSGNGHYILTECTNCIPNTEVLVDRDLEKYVKDNYTKKRF